MKNSGWFPLVGLLSTVVVIGVIWIVGSSSSSKPSAEPIKVSQGKQEPPKSTKEEVPRDWVDVGGIKRPPSDVKATAAEPKDQSSPVVIYAQGYSPALDPNANVQVAGVYMALKERSEPSHFSSFAEAKPFDKEAFESNPKTYLEQFEPSRVFSPAQPGDGVPRIRPADSRYHKVKQGESVNLAVKAAPKAPVTFTSFDLGSFSNQLSSITVQAGDDGLAQAAFTATGGTFEDVKILAGGPMTSGQVQFIVNVSLANN